MHMSVMNKHISDHVLIINFYTLKLKKKNLMCIDISTVRYGSETRSYKKYLKGVNQDDVLCYHLSTIIRYFHLDDTKDILRQKIDTEKLNSYGKLHDDYRQQQ